MRPDALLVNTARGELVDEAALLERLRRGTLRCALDVFAQEPLPSSHELRRLPNVVLTPHSASNTPECRQRAGRQALDLVADWIAGKPLPAVTAARLRSMT
jgi:phosphoglycerate dehydrogenase-like enzyme